MDSTYILCCVLQAFRKRKYLLVNVVCENQKYKQNRRQKQKIPTSGQRFSLHPENHKQQHSRCKALRYVVSIQKVSFHRCIKQNVIFNEF